MKAAKKQAYGRFHLYLRELCFSAPVREIRRRPRQNILPVVKTI